MLCLLFGRCALLSLNHTEVTELLGRDPLSLQPSAHALGLKFATLRVIECLNCCAGSMALAQLPSLMSLDLSYCERVDCQVLSQLAQAPVLQDVILSGCAYIQEEGITSLATSCKSLRR